MEPLGATRVDIQNVTHAPEYHGFKIHRNVGEEVPTNVSVGDFKDDCRFKDIKEFPMDIADHLTSTSDRLANGMPILSG